MLFHKCFRKRLHFHRNLLSASQKIHHCKNILSSYEQIHVLFNIILTVTQLNIAPTVMLFHEHRINLQSSLPSAFEYCYLISNRRGVFIKMQVRVALHQIHIIFFDFILEKCSVFFKKTSNIPCINGTIPVRLTESIILLIFKQTQIYSLILFPDFQEITKNVRIYIGVPRS